MKKPFLVLEAKVMYRGFDRSTSKYFVEVNFKDCKRNTSDLTIYTKEPFSVGDVLNVEISLIQIDEYVPDHYPEET